MAWRAGGAADALRRSGRGNRRLRPVDSFASLFGEGLVPEIWTDGSSSRPDPGSGGDTARRGRTGRA
ncbi:MAG: hypothetical protein ACLUEK_12045 [Oscillospiraceae bacterium]